MTLSIAVKILNELKAEMKRSIACATSTTNYDDAIQLLDNTSWHYVHRTSEAIGDAGYSNLDSSVQMQVNTLRNETTALWRQIELLKKEYITLIRAKEKLAQQQALQDQALWEAHASSEQESQTNNQYGGDDPVDDAYKLARKQLEQFKMADDATIAYIENFLGHVDWLHDSGNASITELISVLNNTHHRLAGHLSSEAYEEMAQSMQGSPSQALQILGSLMVILTALAPVLIIAFTPTILGATASLGAATLAYSGHTFFTKRCQQGLSKVMSELDEAARSEESSLPDLSCYA